MAGRLHRFVKTYFSFFHFFFFSYNTLFVKHRLCTYNTRIYVYIFNARTCYTFIHVYLSLKYARKKKK
jgi:hypothetical protein